MLKRGEVLEKQINEQKSKNRHIAEERNQVDLRDFNSDEEDKYGAVLRPPKGAK